MFVCSRTILLVSVVALSAPLVGQNAVNIGGKWTKSDTIDSANGTKVIIFSLPADEAELGRSPAIQIECNGDGKLIHAMYFADTELLAKDGDYANFQAPAIIPRLRVDKKSFKGLWDLLPDHKSAELDKKTLRAIFKGGDMQVRYTDKAYNNLLDTYSVSGANRHEIIKACGEHDWISEK